jgi:Eukaryotic aspartyl protease
MRWSWTTVAILAALLLGAAGPPAFAACVDAHCTDATSIESARVLLQDSCGCTREGETHEKYSNCVKRTLKLPALTALLPDKRCRTLVLQCERASICGRPDAAVCCVTKKNGSVKASIVASPVACKKGHPCGGSLGLFSRADACAADGSCAGETSTSTTTTTVATSSSTTSSMAPATGPITVTSTVSTSTTTVSSTTLTTSTTTTTVLPSSLPTVSLTGCAQSGYVAAVTIGPQTFALIVDSGSTTLGVAAAACAGCAGRGVSPLYTPGASATDVGLTTGETFGDGASWSGTVFRDEVSLATNSVLLPLVAIATQQMFFGAAACNFIAVPDAYQGIVGLGRAALAVPGTGSYLDTLESTSALGDVFAVQLCGSGGRLWLGGYDPAFTTAAPAFTPMVATSPFYAVTLSDVLVGGTSLGVGASTFGTTLVDIGTTALVLPDAVFSALATAVAADPVFQQNFGGASFFDGMSCILSPQGLAKAQLDAMLPTLALAFPSTAGTTVTLELPATESYLLQQDDTQGNAYYCPGIERAGSLPTIIGANALHTLLTVFDRRHGEIGFAPEQGCMPLNDTVLTSQPSSLTTRAQPPGTRPAPPYRRRRE